MVFRCMVIKGEVCVIISLQRSSQYFGEIKLCKCEWEENLGVTRNHAYIWLTDRTVPSWSNVGCRRPWCESTMKMSTRGTLFCQALE